MAKERVFVGLFSGAAADGIDAAAVAIRGRAERMKVRQLACAHVATAEPLRGRIAALGGQGDAASPAGLAELDRDVGSAFADAAGTLLDALGPAGREVAAIGCSGQVAAVTPPAAGSAGAAVVFGAPAIVAQRTGLPVAGGFVHSDLAAGGRGGPLRAWPQWVLFRHRRLSRVVVHLGWIATLTFVPADAAACDVVAFDTGPGTAVVDAVARERFGRPFDADGAIAAKGALHPALLHELMSSPLPARAPSGRASPGAWGAAYLARLSLMADKHRCGPEDLLTTVTELTARTVARAIGGLTERPHEVVLCGGGAMNIHLAGRIRGLLSPSSTYTAQRYGFDLRAEAAVCYAMLAAARLDKVPAHCPAATGARRPVVLGAVVLP